MTGINGYGQFGPRGLDPRRSLPTDGTAEANKTSTSSTPAFGRAGEARKANTEADRAHLRAELPGLATTDGAKALRETVRGELDRTFGRNATPGMTDAVLEAFESSENLQTLFHRVWSQANA